MSFVDRTYPDIVRDVLTTLTQGVVAETHTFVYDPAAKPLMLPDITLKRRPVRRVSLVSGFGSAATAGDPPVPVVFSLSDYRLVPNPSDATDLNTIRFDPTSKRRPAPNTDITVNYYPRTTDPTPLTDINVGSVTRTVVEAMSRELAALYGQLNIAYDSAFVETATGASLDRVVALLSYQRRKSGRGTGTVTFTRRAGATGIITIPAGTPVTDSKDKIRYLTAERYDMLAAESSADVRVQGETDASPLVDAGILTVIQRAVAGLDTVTNARPTARATDDETDEALRLRARDALLAASKGTPGAIRHGLLALPQVRDAVVDEMPYGVPGEIRITVSLAQPPAGGGDLPVEVLDRIEALRPAGIRVLRAQAAAVPLVVNVTLTLAGSALPAADLDQVHQAVRARLSAEIGKKGVGERVRLRPLTAALLTDARLADVTLSIGAKGAPAATVGQDFQPDAGAGISLDGADITFGADAFAQAPSAAGQPIRVEMRAVVGVVLLAGTTADAVTAELTARLTAYAASLTAGASVDAPSVLKALADDSKYGIDPLKLSLTLTAGDQFALIAQAGQSFQVKPGHTFAVVSMGLAP
jgi:uncharacterized phage protein gp47/JayE